MGRPEIETIIRSRITGILSHGAELPKPVERKVTESMILETIPLEERARTQELSLADIEVVTPPPLPKEAPHEEQLADIGRELHRVAIESELPKPRSFDIFDEAFAQQDTEQRVIVSNPKREEKINLLEPINFQVETYNLDTATARIYIAIENLERGSVIDRKGYVEGNATLTSKPEVMEIKEIVKNCTVFEHKITPTIPFENWVESHKGFKKWQIEEFLNAKKFTIITFIEIETKNKRRAKIKHYIDLIKLENRQQFLGRIISTYRNFLEGAPYYIPPESIDQTLEDLGIKREEPNGDITTIIRTSTKNLNIRAENQRIRNRITKTFEENAFLLTIIDDILSLDNEIEEIEIKVVE